MKLLNTILTASLLALTFNVSATEGLSISAEMQKTQKETAILMKQELEKAMSETLEDSIAEMRKENIEHFNETVVKNLSTQIKKDANAEGIQLLVKNRFGKRINAE